MSCGRKSSRLQVGHELRAVTALAVLDTAAAAVPVLPDNPLEVLEFEQDQGQAPDQDLSVAHPSRLSVPPARCNRPKVLVDVLVRGQREELDELVAERHVLEELARLVVAVAELSDLLLDRIFDVRARDLGVMEPLPDLRA